MNRLESLVFGMLPRHLNPQSWSCAKPRSSERTRGSMWYQRQNYFLAGHSGVDQAGKHCGVNRVSACYAFTAGKSTESTTISDRVLLTMVLSSACSSAGTANLSSVC